jgi:hypothetical protein
VTSEIPNLDTVVVGAGLAGLAAARALIAKGQTVMVVEGRDRVGGRIWAAPCPGTSHPVDWGAEWAIPAHHPRLMALAAACGVRPLPEPGGQRWITPGCRFDGSLDELAQARAGVAAGLSALQRWYDDATRVPGQSLAGLLKTLVPDQTDRALLCAAFFPLTGARPEDVSAGVIRDEIRFHDGDLALTLGADTVRFDRGAGAIATALGATLAPVLRPNWPVSRIETRRDVVRVHGPDGSLTARKVLVAVPVAVLGDIRFDPPFPGIAADLPIRASAGQDTKIWARITGQTPDSILQSDHPLRLVDAGPGGDETMVCAHALSADVADLDDTALAALLSAVCDGATVTAIARQDWSLDPFAKASWMAARAGYHRAVSQSYAMPHGRVQVIGGDVAAHWSGWMEGALISAATGADWAAIRAS